MTTTETTPRIAQSVSISYDGHVIGYAARADRNTPWSLMMDNGLDLLASFIDLDDATDYLIGAHLVRLEAIGS